MAASFVEFFRGGLDREEARVYATVIEAIRTKTRLFVGRFLIDLSTSHTLRSSWSHQNVRLRNYAGDDSVYVNSQPRLAEGRRVEIGIEEAESVLRSGEFDIVLLSQVLTAVDEGLLPLQDILSLMDVRSDDVTLILTGQTIPAEIARNPDLLSKSTKVVLTDDSNYTNYGLRQLRTAKETN
jgi:cob(I)alamin adenosyltransferase